ncbi:MAG: TerC family protein [Actinobacteria bacterium]|nr:TerC family protein [Actinomycetota bacterium]
MDVLLDPVNLLALLTLTVLEIVLGIDNVVFIAIITDSLPPERRNLARRLGLGLALFGRIAMVLGVSWLLTLEHPLFTVLDHDITISGLILIAGGLFLLYKAVREIFDTTELHEADRGVAQRRVSLAGVVAQILLIDMIFAIDSVLTAVGMTDEVLLIIAAITIAIGVMMFFATPVADFIGRHASVKLLALAFLVLIGVMLILEGVGEPIERTTVYVAIVFALGVEYLNFRRRRNLQRRGGGKGVIPGQEGL